MKKRFAILSVSALLALVSLSGCATCPECPVCEDDTDNPGGDPGDNPGENPGGDPGENPGGDPGDNPDPKPDPSEGLIDPADSDWDQAITDLMVTYLGGGILPKIDLGDGELTAEYVKNDEYEDYKSYLSIEGANFLASNLEKAVEVYKEHYWDALMIGETFYASNELLQIEVEVGKTSSGLFELKAFYNEPFNPNGASDWNESTALLISEHFGKFQVPFVYLGTVNYDSSITQEGALLVTGGTWNDGSIGQFRSAFEDWEITQDPESLITLHATKTQYGSTLSATLTEVNNKAQLTVSLDETFDATNQTKWSTEVLAAMDRSLNKTVLPYVYLGSVYPTIDTAATNERNLTLVGKNWDDSILTAASAAFEAEGGWDILPGEGSITFTKANEIDDYEVVITKNEAGAPVLRASRTELYNEETLTDYPEEIKTAFKELYGEEMTVIPFLYLGTAYPTLNTEIPAEHPEDTTKLLIVGGKYEDQILENFKAKFTGWYVEVENTTEDQGSGETMYGDALAVAIKNTDTHTYKVSLVTLGTGEDETAYLEITSSDNTKLYDKKTDWSEGTLSNLETALGSDVKIPYFEMGRDTLEIQFNEYGHLSIEFIADSTNISFRVWSVIDTLTNDGWTVELAHNDTYFNDEAWISSIHGTKTFGEKTVAINVSVTSSSYYRFVMSGSVSLVETYDPAKEVGTWSESIATAVKERYKLDLPYIYLGTDNPYLYDNEEDETLMIIGNAFSNEVFANAKEVLQAHGFLINNAESSSRSTVATKTNDEGNIVTVYVDYNDGRPCIYFELTEVFNPGDETQWDADTKAFLESELPAGVSVPYMYLGTHNVTTSVDTLDNVKKITLLGGNWDNAVVDLAATSLANSQFTVSTTTETLSAYTLLDGDDAKAVRMQISENYDDQIELNIYVDLKPDALIEGFATWESFPDYYGDTVTDAMDQYLGVALPEFVPLGLLPTEDDEISLSGPWNQNSNQYMSITSYYMSYTSYYLYVAMDKLEEEGYTLTYNPFAAGEEMAGFTASKVVEGKEGAGTLYISFGPSSGDFDDDTKGLRISSLFLPDASQFADVTEFAESDKLNINSALDGLDLPYVNLGSEIQRISTDDGEVSITGYNYSASIIENIRLAYGQSGWTVYDTYIVSGGKAYKTIGGYLEANGHVYILTVTPTITNAINGGGAFSGSSFTTQIEITMA